MTGFTSKRRIALDRLDDDDIQVYAQPHGNRPLESDYTSQVAYTRALEAYCDTLAPPKRPWVGLTEQDMPGGEDPMFDHQYFIAGMVYASTLLKEKNT